MSTRSTPSSYHVAYTLTSARRWEANVTELPGVQPAPRRSLAQAETAVRREIADEAETEADALTLVATIRTGNADLDRQVSKARALRDEAKDAEARAAAAAAAAREAATPLAHTLVEQLGVSVRDAGTLLGYSGQVIHSMTKEQNHGK